MTHVLTHIHIGLKIIVSIAVKCGIDAIGFVGRELHATYPEVLRKCVANAIPSDTSVLSKLNVAIVCTHQQRAKGKQRFIYGCDGSIGHISLDTSLGEVFRKGFPLVPLFHRTVEFVAAQIQNVLVVGRQQNGGLPIEAQRRFAQFVFGLDIGVGVFVPVNPVVITKLITGKNDIRIAVVYLNLHAITSHDRVPIVVACLMPCRAFNSRMRSHPNPVVLQSAIDMIRILAIGIYGVELSHRGLVVFDPMGAIVVADIYTSIVSVNQMLRILGIDPQSVVVHMGIGRIDVRKALPSIFGF